MGNKLIKTIAMYLPQFHEIPENNQWWGEGFTEWTAARNAEKLFDGHYQPREPLNDNYYNLLDKKTVERQVQIAKKYNLDGFCFYHYYFKGGKKILEKPAENLLIWKDLDMPFCFCWANESWGRTWSKINSSYAINSWMEKAEEKEMIRGNSTGILLEQKYGREKEWEEHFRYLLPFFQDQRYIKKDGAPVFLIYKPREVYCLAEMIHFWKEQIKKEGFRDLYVIGQNTTKNQCGLDAVLLHGPGMYKEPKIGGEKIIPCIKNGVKTYSYEKLWENAIAANAIAGCNTYFGAFTDYDDTPRRGKNGWVAEQTSTQIFEKYLYLLMKKNKELQNEYVFINAFNEWGEGMYLEPDKRNGYQYLEIMRDIKEQVNKEDTLPKTVMYRMEKKESRTENEWQYKTEKYMFYIKLMDKWLDLKEKRRSLANFLVQHCYYRVAIYGMGILGQHLLTELLDSEIQVEYVIDRKKEVSCCGIPVYKMDSNLAKVDAIIVTAIYEIDEIWNTIRSKGIAWPIVSLMEMVYDV